MEYHVGVRKLDMLAKRLVEVEFEGRKPNEASNITQSELFHLKNCYACGDSFKTYKTLHRGALMSYYMDGFFAFLGLTDIKKREEGICD